MGKQIAIVVFVIIMLVVIGYSGFDKLGILNAESDLEISEKQLTAQVSDYISIKSCVPGNIPFLPSLNSTLSSEPVNIKVTRGKKITIINKDEVVHSLAIEGSKLGSVIEVGGTWTIDTSLLTAGVWSLSCDGLSPGNGPTLVMYDPF